MRIGVICRADNTGLGVLTTEFAVNMKPAKALVLDLSPTNPGRWDVNPWMLGEIRSGAEHGRVLTTRYQEIQNTIEWGQLLPEVREGLDWLLEDVDVVFTAETPYFYALYTEAARRGVATVNQHMWEYFPYIALPALPMPDAFWAPSRWCLEQFPFPERLSYVPVPVNTDRFPLIERKVVSAINHPAGNRMAEDRNGTYTYLEMLRHLTTKVRAHVTGPQEPDLLGMDYPLTPSGWDGRRYYEQAMVGDLTVLPRRFAGLCLPMQESLAAGVPVVMSNVSPQNSMLLQYTLVNPATFETINVPIGKIPSYAVGPKSLARRVDWLIQETEAYAIAVQHALRWREAYSWNSMRSVYVASFAQVIERAPCSSS